MGSLSEARREVLKMLAGDHGATSLMFLKNRISPKLVIAMIKEGFVKGDSPDIAKCWRFYITESGRSLLRAAQDGTGEKSGE